MPGMPQAMLQVLVTARGIAKTNGQLAGVQGNLNKTGASAGRMGAAMKKGLLIGAAAVASLIGGLFKLGKSFDEAYDTIRVGTGATGKQLDRLKGDFKEVVKGVPTDFKSAGEAIAELNTRLGLTGKPLQDRAKQFLELSRITGTDVKGNIVAVTKAFNDWGVPVERQGRVLDGFFRVSQATGISVQDLTKQVQESGSPLRQLGFSLEEAATMLAGFDKAGVNTSKMTSGFQQAITNLTRPTGTLKESMKSLGIAAGDPKKGLEEVMRVMTDKSIPAAERTGLAMDVFGRRAGADVAEAIKQGRFAVGDLMDTMRNGSDTIMKAGADTMDFGEKWTLFKNRVLVALEPIAMRVFDGIGKAMDVLPGIAARVIAAIAAIISPFVAVGRAVTGSKEAMIALAPIAVMLAAHFVRLAAVAAFGAVLRGLTTAFWLLNAAMRANPIMIVVTLLSVLGAALVLAYQKSETFRAIVDGVFSWLKGASAVFGFVASVVSAAWNWIKNATSDTWNWIKGALSTVWNAIKAVAKFVWGAISLVIITPIRWVRDRLSDAWDWIARKAKAVWESLKQAADFYWKLIRRFIIDPIRSAADWVIDKLRWLAEKMVAGWEIIKFRTKNAWANIRTAIINPIRSAAEWVWDKVKWLAGKIEGGFRGIWRIAKDFATGLKDRIVSAFKGVVNTVGGFINKIIRVVNKIPGVDIKYRFTPMAEGGTMTRKAAAQGLADAGLARGGVINRPTVLTGEDAPQWPEYVIPTNPAYRDRAMALTASAAQKIGMPGFARGGIWSKDELAGLWRRANDGLGNSNLMAAIALAESGGNPRAHGPPDGRGLWQIEWPIWRRALGYLGNPYNALPNAKMAGEVLRRQGIRAWVAYTNGSYKRFTGGKGISGVLGDIASALNPMDFIKKLPGVGGLPGWIQGLGTHVLGKVKDYIRDKVASALTGSSAIPGGVSGNIQDAIRFSRAFGNWTFSPGQLWRPGGKPFHGWGRAVDFGDAGKSRKQMQMLYKGLKGKYGKNIKELFWDPAGEHVKNGQTIGRPFGGHGDHIHLALAQGGLFSKAGASMAMPQFGGSFANGGIVPGPVGQPRTVIAHGGERIGPPGWEDVQIVVHNYIGGERIDERVDTRIEIRDRQKEAAWRAGIAT